MQQHRAEPPSSHPLPYNARPSNLLKDDDSQHDTNILIMNLVLLSTFVVTLFLLISILRLTSAASDEIELLRKVLRS